MINVGPFQGRLARDPKFEHVGQSATPKWQATIVVDEPGYNSQTRQTDVFPLWVAVEAWGTLAEDLWEAGYGQGDEMAGQGRLSQFTIGEGDKKETKTRVRLLWLHCTRRKTPRPQGAPSGSQGAPGGTTGSGWGGNPPTDEPPF